MPRKVGVQTVAKQELRVKCPPACEDSFFYRILAIARTDPGPVPLYTVPPSSALIPPPPWVLLATQKKPLCTFTE